jgi:hypothetical protein
VHEFKKNNYFTSCETQYIAYHTIYANYYLFLTMSLSKHAFTGNIMPNGSNLHSLAADINTLKIPSYGHLHTHG